MKTNLILKIRRIFFTFSVIISTQSNGAEVTFNESFEAQFLKSNRTEKFEQEKTTIQIKEPTLVKSASKIPTLIIPIRADENVDLQLVTVEDHYKNHTFEQANLKLSEIVFEIIQIQDLIRGKKINEAENKITEVQKNYPKLYFVLFLKASVEYLKGEKENSLTIVTEALKHYPEYKPGIEFKSELEKILNKSNSKKEAS